MTSEEIRKIEFKHGYSKPNDENTFLVLREIAAQLAEVKELLNSGANGQANVLAWMGEAVTVTHP